jgi:hypothetical protein
VRSPDKHNWHDDARQLRREGMSCREIAERLGRNVKTVESVFHHDRVVAQRGEQPKRKRNLGLLESAPAVPGLLPVWHSRQTIDFARVDVDVWQDLRDEHIFTMAGEYVATSLGGKTVYLHHMVLGPVPRSSGMQADHINKDRFDNRRCNLRIVTAKENQRNRGGKFERCWARQEGIGWSAAA